MQLQRKSHSVLFLLFPLLLITGRIYGQAQLIATSGSTIHITGEAHIILNDASFENNGTFTAGNSTVTLTGTTTDANSSIGGTVTTGFYHLTINKASNGVQLGNDINIAHTLTMSQGNLDLNGYDVTLDATNGNLAGEGESNRVWDSNGSGLIQLTVDLNAPNSVDVGGLGAVISSSQNLGSTFVGRGHSPENLAANEAVRRYYTITPTNNTGLDATLIFNYLDAEVGSLLESELNLLRKPSGGEWGLEGGTIDAVNNTLTKTGITSFSSWAAGGTSALPVSLVFFQIECQDGQPYLQWQTASEQQSNHFIIERSSNGQNWAPIGKVEAQGNSDYTTDYHWQDEEPLNNAYYRLIQQDINGDQQTFHTVYTDCLEDVTWELKAFPNPTLGMLNFQLISENTENALFWLYDVAGKEIAHSTLKVNAPQALELSNVPTGLYILRVKQDNRQEQIKIIKH